VDGACVKYECYWFHILINASASTGVIGILQFSRGFFMGGGLGIMIFNATFNNISVISWRSVFLVEEIGASH
jgi:hypothetical protein